MTLPTIDGLHYVGCHCNDICACSYPIECIHEQCICDRLSAAYKQGYADGTKDENDQEMSLTEMKARIAAARGEQA